MAGLKTYELSFFHVWFSAMMAENGLFLEVGCKTKTLICFAVLQMYELFFFHVLFLEVTAHVLFLEVPGHVNTCGSD